MKLYEIAEELAAIDRAIEDSGGELTPETEAALDALQGALDGKVERIVCLIRSHQRTAEAAHAEADRLRQVERTSDRAAQSLKGYLMRSLEAAGRTRAGGPIGGARVQANPPAARCRFSGLQIPTPYRRETVTFAFDAKQALTDYRDGMELPDGIEVVKGYHIRLT